MWVSLLIGFFVVPLPDLVQASSVCQKMVFYTQSAVKTHEVLRKVTYRKWNGRTGYEFKPFVENYTTIVYLTKTIDVCCAGYTLLRGKCVPLCDRVCENSNCTAPNTCTCFEGYEKFHDFRCIPHCENCIYGYCSAPNYCSCYRGFEKNENDVCQPVCTDPCINGICSHPETCTCAQGYQFKPNSTTNCEPKCDPPCEYFKVGSICTAPNFCQCSEKYFHDLDLDECIPICSNCKNGKCVAPETCECAEGYDRSSNGSCDPKCKKDCANGLCSSPEKCTCDEGYEQDPDDPFRCFPVCDNCTFGDCIFPNECLCWQGYEMNRDGQCEPICNQTCINGFCAEPGICECFEGYEDITADPYECVPICEDCGKGHCIAPGTCECWQGYLQADNGTCVAKCFDGYTLSSNYPETCDPVCEGCEYGNCTEPAKCSCWPDYSWNETSLSCVLIPAIDDFPGELLNLNHTRMSQPNNENCKLLNCTDGVCKCGSELLPIDDSSNESTSSCEDTCINGFCDDQNNCVCAEGHDLINDTECVSKCNIECINGYCIEPDLCECWEGFVIDYNQPTTNYCVPLCDSDENGCINGTCIKPDICECFQGYELSSDDKFVCVQKSSSDKVNQQKLNLLPLWIILCITIAFIIVGGIYFYNRNLSKGKGYNVDEKEKYNGVVKFTRGQEKVAVI